jgi:hypothetical protein
MSYQITDTITGNSTTCPAWDIEDQISAWYDLDEEGISEAIDRLQEQCLRHEYFGEPAAFLALSIEAVA